MTSLVHASPGTFKRKAGLKIIPSFFHLRMIGEPASRLWNVKGFTLSAVPLPLAESKGHDFNTAGSFHGAG